MTAFPFSPTLQTVADQYIADMERVVGPLSPAAKAKARALFSDERICPACDGRGFEIDEPHLGQPPATCVCHRCQGKGTC